MVYNRFEFRHWEIDLILGKKNKEYAVVLILVEHQTRLSLACKLPNKQGETINESVKELMFQYPIASMTSDNESEFSLLVD